jgi:energy-coupling factor transporter ATP-binding protein EcfA2
MINFDKVSFAYHDQSTVVIKDFSAQLLPGEFHLVVGRTGSGKSTLLSLVNGIAPHLTGGLLAGDVTVFGMNTKQFKPRDFANSVGVVVQDPRNSFVTNMVEDELAYAMECLGVEPKAMRQRIDEAAELMGLTKILQQSTESLSAGQQQRLAIASVLVNRPQALVLDEPTSALDPAAAEEVLAALQRLVHDLGITVIAAEHRLERILQFADTILHVPGKALPISFGSPAEIMELSEIAPPIVQLGKELGWNPLPLSVREARKYSTELISKLDNNSVGKLNTKKASVAELDSVHINYGQTKALINLSLNLFGGEILAVLGKNGAGKSTLLATLAGLIKPNAGKVLVNKFNPADLSGNEFITQIGFVPQEPADLLLQPTIAQECLFTDVSAKLTAGSTAKKVKEFLPDVDLTCDPNDLSEGQRLLLVLALCMASTPKLLLLDEPTRGLDYDAKERLISALNLIANTGTAIAIATHDVELVAELNASVLMLSAGEVIAQGSAREVLTESVAFAPQIARVFSPLNLLTIEEVVDAIKLAG